MVISCTYYGCNASHKEAYLVGAGCLVVGDVGALVLSPRVINMVDVGNLKFNSPTNSIVVTQLARRGHPGYIIRDEVTGEVAASLRRMVEITKMSATAVRKEIGDRFTILGEASA
jgi:hypothetical protein